MSEDYDFDEFDSAFLEEVADIEAAHVAATQPGSSSKTTSSNLTAVHSATPKPISPTWPRLFRLPSKPTITSSFSGKRLSPKKASPRKASPRKPPAGDTSFDYGIDDDFDEDILAQVDAIESAYQKNPATWKPPPLTRQTTLDGTVMTSQPGPSSTQRSSQKSGQKEPSASHPFGQKPKKIKSWDRTAFAKSGWKLPKGAKKGKGRAGEYEEGDEEEETIEFEQFPAPFISLGPAPTLKLAVDMEAAKEWIYPLNPKHTRRDYQFNIVRASLFENTLVALPTGLGKTFIAGVIMLNYYRWFPQGKVVFVAPTKPLVAQQIEACHQTCGIPGSDAIELTGNIQRQQRARAWADKRVFYMTPQTLMNDLASENCDPRDIVLLVIDEAHRATGDYAYCQIVRYLEAMNANYRILALTATPGATPPAVQSVVDSLHISHIEIRDEKSLDLRQYIHEKNLEVHVIQLCEDFAAVRDVLITLMEKYTKQLSASGVLYVNDVVKLNAYRCQAKTREIMAKPGGQKNFSAIYALATLGGLARGMGYLMEQSMGMAYRSLKDFAAGGESGGDFEGASSSKSKKKPSKQAKLLADPTFQKLLREMETQRDARAGQFPTHPKLEKLVGLILDHFQAADEEAKKNGDHDPEKGDPTTRAMVFVSFRDCVEEVVQTLNQHSPMLRATRFVGQSTDKSGKKGISQKEQTDVIRRFKEGEFNILVSTSIGEEGLDIGEVDLIVCYDSTKTPIRTLQRLGRTGRKRAGCVSILQIEGREEENYNQSKVNYKEVQQSIVRGGTLELFADIKRLLPDKIKPQCVEKEVTIEPYVKAAAGKSKSTAKSSMAGSQTTKKRKPGAGLQIPEGASGGFVSVKDLITKKPKAKRKANADVEATQDDGVEHNQAEPSEDVPPRLPKKRKLSTAKKTSTISSSNPRNAPSSSSGKTKPLRRNASGLMGLMTARELSAELKDDSDDMDIEAGLSALASPRSKRPKSRGNHEHSQSRHSPPPIPPGSPPDSTGPISIDSSPPTSPERQAKRAKPIKPASRTGGRPAASRPKPFASPLPKAATVKSNSTAMDMSWLLGDSDDEGRPSAIDETALDTTIEFEDSFEMEISKRPGSPFRRARDLQESPAMPSFQPANTLVDMDEEMDASFEVRAPGRRVARDPKHLEIDNSPSTDLSFPVQGPARRRVRRGVVDPIPVIELSSPGPSIVPPPKRTSRKQKALLSRIGQEIFEMEAAHSGDDVSLGGSDVEDENEYDASFVHDGPVTQAPAGYDQRAVYHLGLMTQVPAAGPAFATKPKRNGQYAAGGRNNPPQRPMVSSSPRPEAGSEDYYELGSFVVEDDDDVLLAEPSSES